MSEVPKVYIVAVSYGCEGISQIPESFLVFENEIEARQFIERADNVGGATGTRVLIPAEFVRKP